MTISPLALDTPLATSSPARSSGTQGSGASFSRYLQQAQPGANANASASSRNSAGTVVVKRGDTLIGLIRSAATAQGKDLSGHDAWRLAQQVASSNGLKDVNLIHPGQTLRLQAIQGDIAQLPSRPLSLARVPLPMAPQAPVPPNAVRASPQGPLATGSTQAALALRMAQGLSEKSATRVAGQPAFGQVAALKGAPSALRIATPVLDKTLQRAVDKGFIAPHEVENVKTRIAALSQKYNFLPDDFARLTLMESDGMNPQASNGSCHGIIQFCDGDDRGAASVGFARDPRAILGLSTVAQLDLVDKYFSDVGVGKNGRERLDDLYLSVLTPNARSEVRRHVPLNIPGQQAAYLHVGKDTSRPITRQSIWAGLYQNANDRLRDVPAPEPTAAAQSWKVSAYKAQP